MWMRCGWDEDEIWMKYGWDVDEMWMTCGWHKDDMWGNFANPELVSEWVSGVNSGLPQFAPICKTENYKIGSYSIF